MSYGITGTGFVPKDYSTIVSELQQEAIRLFGDNTDLRDTNPLMVLINIMAAREQVLWNSLADMYSNFFIITANGTALDLLAVDRGLTRTAAVKATGTVTFTGTAGSVIEGGIIVSTSGDDVQQFTTSEVGGIGLTTENFNSTTFNNSAYQVTLAAQAFGAIGDGKLTVFIGNTEQTQQAVIGNLSAGEFHCDYANPSVISLNDDPGNSLVTVTYYDNAATTDDVSVIATLGGSASNVGSGSINTIVSNVIGLTAVNNSLAVSGGVNEETDANLRQRLIDVPVAEWTEADLETLVENITGVKDAVVDDGEIVETFTSVSGTGPFTVDLSTDTTDVFRVVYFDSSAGTRTDLTYVATSPSAGQYTLTVNSSPTADQIEFDLSSGFDAGDTLTVTYMDSSIGVGIFELTIVPDTPPLSSTLRDTIESTVKLNKPFGVSFIINEPTFSYVKIDATVTLLSGFDRTGVSPGIEESITAYFNSLSANTKLRHYQIIELIMAETGVEDVTAVQYSILNEVVTRGATVGGDDALSQSSTSNTVDTLPATITDAKGNVYALATDYELNSENIRWSTAGAIANMVYRLEDQNGANPTQYSTTLTFTINEADDAFLIGGDDEFSLIKFEFSSPMSASNFAYEYSTGAGTWSALTNVVDTSDGLTTNNGIVNYISFTKPSSGWVTATYDSATKYWIRIRQTTLVTEAPVLSNIELHYEPAPDSTYTVSEYEIDLNITAATLTIAGLPAQANLIYVEGDVDIQV
jgi:uncharacterized phage protein gp47/JayE